MCRVCSSCFSQWPIDDQTTFHHAVWISAPLPIIAEASPWNGIPVCSAARCKAPPYSPRFRSNGRLFLLSFHAMLFPRDCGIPQEAIHGFTGIGLLLWSSRGHGDFDSSSHTFWLQSSVSKASCAQMVVLTVVCVFCAVPRSCSRNLFPGCGRARVARSARLLVGVPVRSGFAAGSILAVVLIAAWLRQAWLAFGLARRRTAGPHFDG